MRITTRTMEQEPLQTRKQTPTTSCGQWRHGRGWWWWHVVEEQREYKEKINSTNNDQTRDHPNVEELSTYIDVNAPTLVRKWRISSSKVYGHASQGEINSLANPPRPQLHPSNHNPHGICNHIYKNAHSPFHIPMGDYSYVDNRTHPNCPTRCNHIR